MAAIDTAGNRVCKKRRQDILIDGTTQVYGIFGYPVKHTLSPALHNAAFRSLGMNACYVPMEVSLETYLNGASMH